MNDFVFKFIFENTKDKAFNNSMQFRKYLWETYGIKEKELGTELYIAINKYQVKKYGRSINPIFEYHTKETERIKTQINQSRKQQKKKRKGFWLN